MCGHRHAHAHEFGAPEEADWGPEQPLGIGSHHPPEGIQSHLSKPVLPDHGHRATSWGRGHSEVGHKFLEML